jgi:uncharacterized Zn-binding protein involved in type VI secretion
MPAAARLFDATNHPGVIIRPGAANVLINDLPAARMGDLHACTLPPLAGPHPPSTIVGGSSTVLIGNQPAARMGDLSGCGATIIAGSANVIIGG